LIAPRILAVDGDECTRELLRLHLEGAGYEVQVAEDAAVAVRMVLRRPPDLIIADLNMRYLDGLEFLAALREDDARSRVAVIFLTDGDARVERAVAGGAQRYLVRPIFAPRLLAMVAERLSAGFSWSASGVAARDGALPRLEAR